MKKFLFIVIVFSVVISIIGCSNQTIKKTEESWEESPTLVREVIITDDGQTDDFIFRVLEIMGNLELENMVLL